MKEILFVIPTIACGGAERGLVELLKKIDYSKYKVDLMLFRKDDMYYENQIPKEVNILENDEETKLAFNHIKNVIKSPLCFKKPNVALYRIWETSMSKIRKFLKIKRHYYDWKILKKYVPKLKKEYDIAIGFLGGNSIYYIVDKVKANKKIGFFRADFEKAGFKKEFDLQYFKKLDCLFTVSDEMRDTLKKLMPEITDKFKTLYNILDLEKINERANENVEFDEKYTGTRIISIGNLKYVKGYDIAIKTCKILKDKGYKFKWYILGEGKERKSLERLIQKNDLQDTFILLGLISNPYAYLKRADIYVQTSRHEGFSTSVREAKAFKKPIVVTDCPGMSNQIENKVNGSVTTYDINDIAQAISELLDDEELRKKYINHLQTENLYNSIEEQMNVLYSEF